MLSYLLLLLLPHWWPWSGCTLCIVHYFCTLTLTLTRRQPSELVALSFAFVNDFVLRFHSVHSIGYNFQSIFFSLAILLRNQQLLFKFILSVGIKQRAITTLDSEHVTHCSYFFVVLLRSFQPHFYFGYLNLVCSYIFVCVTFQPLFDFCSVPNLPHLRQFVHSSALQWLPILILLGTGAHQTFGLRQLFPNLQKGLMMIQFRKMCFCNTFSWNSWTQNLSDRSGPYGLSHHWKIKLPTPSGHQTTATFLAW